MKTFLVWWVAVSFNALKAFWLALTAPLPDHFAEPFPRPRALIHRQIDPQCSNISKIKGRNSSSVFLVEYCCLSLNQKAEVVKRLVNNCATTKIYGTIADYFSEISTLKVENFVG